MLILRWQMNGTSSSISVSLKIYLPNCAHLQAYSTTDLISAAFIRHSNKLNSCEEKLPYKVFMEELGVQLLLREPLKKVGYHAA
jgi:hypothetical protein